MTWLDLPPGTGFGVANLPFGIFSRAAGRPARPEGRDESESAAPRRAPTPHPYASAEGHPRQAKPAPLSQPTAAPPFPALAAGWASP